MTRPDRFVNGQKYCATCGETKTPDMMFIATTKRLRCKECKSQVRTKPRSRKQMGKASLAAIEATRIS